MTSHGFSGAAQGLAILLPDHYADQRRELARHVIESFVWVLLPVAEEENMGSEQPSDIDRLIGWSQLFETISDTSKKSTSEPAVSRKPQFGVLEESREGEPERHVSLWNHLEPLTRQRA